MSVGNDKSKGGNKGFSGLSSLISDVEAGTPADPQPTSSKPPPTPSSIRQAQHQAPPPPNPQAVPPPSSQSQARQPQAATPGIPAQRAKPSSSSNAWVIWLLVIGGVIWAIAASDNKPKVPTRPTEQKPSVGRNNVLSYNELHYCLAEDIRMEGVKSVLNNYSDADVNWFNTMVADYNSRCGEFKYRQGSLEGARRNIEPWRSEIYREGQSGLTGRGSSGSVVVPPKAVTPTKSSVAATTPQQANSNPAVINPWNNQGSSNSTNTQQQNHAAAEAAVQAEWESELSRWARSHSEFLADSYRAQQMQSAINAVDAETGSALGHRDLLERAYQRAAISTGWLTVIHSTPEGKPIPQFNPYAVSDSSGVYTGPSSCPTGTTWVSAKGQCCDKLEKVQTGGSAVRFDWIGCRSHSGSHAAHGHANSKLNSRANGKTDCVFKPVMSEDDLRACGINPEMRSR